MTTLRAISLSALLALIAGCGSTGPYKDEFKDLVPGPAPSHVVTVKMSVAVDGIPADGRELRMWVPLIQSDSHQRIVDSQILAPLRPMVRYGPTFANAMMYFPGDAPLPSSVSASLSFSLELHRCIPLTDTSSRPLTPEEIRDMAPYLETSRQEDSLKQSLSVLADRIAREQNKAPLIAEQQSLSATLNHLSEDNDSLRAIAAKLGGPNLSGPQLARKVYNHVLEKLQVAESTVAVPDRTLLDAYQSGQVTQLEYVKITVFMLRTLGVPSRIEYGVQLPDALPAEPVELTGPHLWIGFFSPATGWVPVNPIAALANRQLTDYYFGTDCAGRVRFGWGTGIELSPKQIGDPIPVFYEPRVEVDDKILPVTFRVTAFDLTAKPVSASPSSSSNVAPR